MKPEAQRIAIAEACGWKKCRYVEGLRDVIGEPPAKWKGYYVPGQEVAWAPNYLGDLNAMHEAEIWLKNDDPHAFACYASDLFEEHGSDAIHLSASQRAKAFLKILNLWTEE